MQVDTEHAAEFMNLNDQGMLDRIKWKERKPKYMFYAEVFDGHLRNYKWNINGVLFDVRDGKETWHGKDLEIQWFKFMGKETLNAYWHRSPETTKFIKADRNYPKN